MKGLKVLSVLGLAVFMVYTARAEVNNSVEEVLVKSQQYDGTVVEYQVSILENTRWVVMPYRERDFKSYMDYRRLGKYFQKDLQDVAITDSDGFRRVDDRYIVAVGTGVCKCVGEYITLVLENGTEIECIVGDIKDDIHTQENNIVTSANLCVSEFIIDSDVMSKRLLSKGSVSFAFEEWKSKVEYIKLEGKNYFSSDKNIFE